MRLAVVILAGSLFAAVAGSGCTAGVRNVGGTGGTGGGGQPTGSGGAPPVPTGPCEGRQCQQSTCTRGPCTVPACPGGGRTTVSGKVYDPAGKNPLYNITVYVPNKTPAPYVDGPTCDPCDASTGTSVLSGQPISITKTDVAGAFKLGTVDGDVPAGDNIPLVIQVGKWRREVIIPHVQACANTDLPDINQTRLPRNQSEGHLPKIALTTGERDAMECLLRKIGVADSEFTPEAGPGRVNLYAGGGGAASYDTTVNAGAAFTPVNPWWDSLDNLKKYDIVLHACEGTSGSFQGNNDPLSVKSPAARQALMDYANLGGRVFASHWHVYWLEKGPAPFQTIATFNHSGGTIPPDYPATIDQSFTTGQAMAQWMTNVGGSTMPGIVNINQNANGQTVVAVAGSNISQRWIYASTLNPQSVLYLSATTPVPGGRCGRVVFSDLHVSSGGPGSDMPALPFPTGCVTTDLSPQEKVLEFMLFDISTCVAPVVP